MGLGWRHPHYAQMLAERPALAFLEVHSENFFADGGAALEVLQRGRALYPVSLHGVGLSLGSAVGLDDWHLAQLARLVERIDPVRVSDHASFARGPWAGQSASAATQTAQASVVHAADLLPIPWTHEALAVMAANVQRVQERLRRPIAVENLSAYLSWAQADFSEPDFLTELARRTGCHLLVDVNNLMVNALNAHGAPRLPGQPGHASPPAPGAVGAWGAPAPAAAPAAPESMRRAASASRAVAYLSGKTPTDMPRSRLTSKVLTMSIQPSAWARVPCMTRMLRTVSTRTMASAAAMGRRMAAISLAPRYCSGMMTAP